MGEHHPATQEICGNRIESIQACATSELNNRHIHKPANLESPSGSDPHRCLVATDPADSPRWRPLYFCGSATPAPDDGGGRAPPRTKRECCSRPTGQASAGSSRRFSVSAPPPLRAEEWLPIVGLPGSGHPVLGALQPLLGTALRAAGLELGPQAAAPTSSGPPGGCHRKQQTTHALPPPGGGGPGHLVPQSLSRFLMPPVFPPGVWHRACDCRRRGPLNLIRGMVYLWCPSVLVFICWLGAI